LVNAIIHHRRLLCLVLSICIEDAAQLLHCKCASNNTDQQWQSVHHYVGPVFSDYSVTRVCTHFWLGCVRISYTSHKPSNSNKHRYWKEQANIEIGLTYSGSDDD